MSANDFFADDPVDPLERDRWKRPLLVPRGGGPKQAYTRASTMGGYLSDSGGLHTWQKRLLTSGLGRREDLTAMAAALSPLTGDKKIDRPVNAKLDEIIDLASEIGGAHVKANYGTTIHSLCEPGSEGTVPEDMRADVESFRALGLDIKMTEQFVANDHFMAAGSFDFLVALPGIDGLVCSDIKTGQVKPCDVAVQLAVYAGGEAYDAETNVRTPLPPVNQDVGCLIHIPAREGKTVLHLVDLNAGRQAASVAAWVRDYRKRKDILTDFALTPSKDVFVPPWLVGGKS